MASAKKIVLIPGTLNLLILKALGDDNCHGFEIQERIVRQSGNLFDVEEGSLYPALSRMADMGLIQGEWGISDRGRRARFYSVTRKGKRELEKEIKRWRLASEAIERVLCFA